ncbi:MAG: hypothetical protein GY705_01590 [Bacteroidetes bacterium]|nr:hypothetical protein [Bacteroidota bacterium]
MTTSESKQRIVAILAVIIVALLAVNAVLLIKYNKKDKVIVQQEEQIDEADQLKAELEKQYYEALSELEEMRGSNEELNTLIEKQKEEVTRQKGQIEKLISNKRDLARAREEMKKLSGQVEQYVAEINQLRAEKEELIAKTEELSGVNQELQQNLQIERVEKQELTTQQAQLVKQKDALEMEKTRLSKKVNIASVIKVESVNVTGLKTKKSGKAVKKVNASNIDHLNVCFNTTANEVTNVGKEIYYIRIVNPLGETLAIEELGSGVLKNGATGEQVRYTQAIEFDYDREAGKLCSIWQPNVPFQAGTYSVEVYNKGFLAGNGNFVLK